MPQRMQLACLEGNYTLCNANGDEESHTKENSCFGLHEVPMGICGCPRRPTVIPNVRSNLKHTYVILNLNKRFRYKLWRIHVYSVSSVLSLVIDRVLVLAFVPGLVWDTWLGLGCVTAYVLGCVVCLMLGRDIGFQLGLGLGFASWYWHGVGSCLCSCSWGWSCLAYVLYCNASYCS